MNEPVKKHLAKLCVDVQSTVNGAPICVFWIGDDGIPRAVFHPRRGDGAGQCTEQLAMFASLSELVAVAADGAIACISKAAGEPEDHLRLAYLHMKDKARAGGHRIVEGTQ